MKSNSASTLLDITLTPHDIRMCVPPPRVEIVEYIGRKCGIKHLVAAQRGFSAPSPTPHGASSTQPSRLAFRARTVPTARPDHRPGQSTQYSALLAALTASCGACRSP